jgi:hypothetical protein
MNLDYKKFERDLTRALWAIDPKNPNQIKYRGLLTAESRPIWHDDQVESADIEKILGAAALAIKTAGKFEPTSIPELPSLPVITDEDRETADAWRSSIADAESKRGSGFFNILFGSPRLTGEQEELKKKLSQFDYARLQLDRAVAQVSAFEESLQCAFEQERLRLEKLKAAISLSSDEVQPLQQRFEILDKWADLHHAFRRPIKVSVDAYSRRALLCVEVSSWSDIQLVKERNFRRSKMLTKRDLPRERERLLTSLMIRAAHLLVHSDIHREIDTYVVNAESEWRDESSGKPMSGCIASFQASRETLEMLEVEHLDPIACFRALKGVRPPNFEQHSIVRPFFYLNKDDDRIVDGRDISEVKIEENLAVMDWEVFEHLVRQLFEWEFGGEGVEVKVTRASRDRGVDAIMFDPDPIRGGKYVIQAKRYTNTVGVEAVRDLYGTVINEGANRGILVTTSGYGPDAYEFSKDKPITLVNGDGLLSLLAKHGKQFRIDLSARF